MPNDDIMNAGAPGADDSVIDDLDFEKKGELDEDDDEAAE